MIFCLWSRVRLSEGWRDMCCCDIMDYMECRCMRISGGVINTITYNMYRLALTRDQHQTTTLSIATNHTTALIKTHRIIHNHLPSTHKMSIDFSIHEGQEQGGRWGAMQQSLREHFEELVSGQRLYGSMLKVHIFVVQDGGDMQSVIFNGVWINFLLHGVPLLKSVYHHQWNTPTHTQPITSQNKALFDLHSPTDILAGVYSSPPPAQIASICSQYKQTVTDFLRREWGK